jgi:DNA-binding transcriptional LysR family regulator
MKLSTRQLQAFLLAVDLRSFTKAAQALHITQAGLSSMIREMEVQLGQTLFARSPQGIEVTEEGLQFLAYAKDAMIALEKGVDALKAYRRRREGGIRVAASPTICTALMPGVVRRMANKMPNVNVDVMDTDPQTLTTLVENDDVDAAYCNDPIVSQRLQRELLFSTNPALIVPLELCPTLQSLSCSDDWEPLLKTGLIALPLDTRNVFQSAVERMLVEWQAPALERRVLRHYTTAIQFVEEGLGVAFLPNFMLHLANPAKTRRVPIGYWLPIIDYYCITRSDRQIPEAVRQLNRLLSAAGSAGQATPLSQN